MGMESEKQKAEWQVKMDKKAHIQPSYDTDRQILGKVYPLRTPFNVIIDSSEACNFRCNYCFRYDDNRENWGYAAGGRLMDWDIFVRSFNCVKEFPDEVRQISLSNHGEPLCNKKLPAMARYMRDNGFKGRISIHTNGSFLNHEFASELALSGLSRIVISLQGMNTDKYREICGVSCRFEELVDNISVLYDTKMEAGASLQVDVKIADVALDEGEEELFFELFSPISDRVFVENIVPIWKNVGQDNVEQVNNNKFGKTFPKQKCCPLIFHTIVVAPNGDIYPCTQLLNEHKLGNIKDDSLVDCWNRQERSMLLKDILSFDAPGMCDNCYILQNSIYAKEDMIDEYRIEILSRID